MIIWPEASFCWFVFKLVQLCFYSIKCNSIHTWIIVSLHFQFLGYFQASLRFFLFSIFNYSIPVGNKNYWKATGVLFFVYLLKCQQFPVHILGKRQLQVTYITLCNIIHMDLDLRTEPFFLLLSFFGVFYRFI